MAKAERHAPTRKVTGARDDAAVRTMLERLAKALTSGDGKTVARMWAVPALVMSDDMARPVASLEEVEQFFAGARQQYNDRGVTDTRPEVERIDWATDRIAIAHVRWPWLDADDEEVGTESSIYVLKRGDDGELRVQAVIMQGASEAMEDDDGMDGEGMRH
jgi:ketosteroid isomerase-like protein